jgi:hypothetical protein
LRCDTVHILALRKLSIVLPAMVQRTHRTFVLFLCVLAVLVPQKIHAQSMARTLPRALDQLTAEADLIVHGFVVSTKVEPHPQLTNLMTVRVSMNVIDTYKGKPQKSIVFRQYLWDLRAQLGATEYSKGQELLLLLGPVSEFGLTSPVGLEQGRFLISRDAKGKALAVNGRGNLGLFDSVDKRAQARGLQLSARTAALVRRPPAGPLSLADLEDAIRTFGSAR